MLPVCTVVRYCSATDLKFKIFDNGAPVLPSGSSSLVVLQSCSDSANLFFFMYLSPLSSISASILVLDELVPCEYHCNASCCSSSCPGPRSIASYVSIGLLLAHLSYSTPTLLHLWESILRINLHLSSTIERDGLLVQFPASADSALHRRSSCSRFTQRFLQTWSKLFTPF